MARVSRRARAARELKTLEQTCGKSCVLTIRNTFDCMEIAEEEIAAGKARHPDRADEVNASFMLLLPPSALRGMSFDVYRYHARELVERVAAGEDTRPATGAEVMACLSSNSLRAPLEANAQALYERLFAECMPAQAEVVLGGPQGAARERWEGAVDELLVEMRRKLRVETRITKGADE